ncbi:MAG TPA: hypothetical protein DIC64_01650 [Alphaproteobacteria bacterium]|nr:hypothetical protein [Alphaproteobacteria bacterium]
MDVYINKSSAYIFKEEKLTKLGTAIPVKEVFENFFQVKNDVYRVDEDNQTPSLFLPNCQILKFKKNRHVGIDERLDALEEGARRAYPFKDLPVYQEFQRMKKEFSDQWFEAFVKKAFVTVDKEGFSRLWVKSKKGNIVEKTSEISNVNVGYSKGFVYKGSFFYIDSCCVVRTPLIPVFYRKNYIVFRAGLCAFWALCQTKKGVEIKRIGAFNDCYKTPFGTLLCVRKGVKTDAWFLLGEKLQEFDSCVFHDDSEVKRKGGVLYLPKKAHIQKFKWINGCYKLGEL